MSYLTFNGKYLRYGGKMLTTTFEPPPPPDSVEASESHLYYDGTGLALYKDTVTLTSSGTWTRSYIDTGDGISWCLAWPSSDGNGDTCTIQCSGGYEGIERNCTVRFTVGTAHDDVLITQIGAV